MPDTGKLDSETENFKHPQPRVPMGAFFRSLVDAIREALLVLSDDLTVEFANQAFYKKFKTDAAQIIGYKIFEMDNGQWNIPPLLQVLMNGLLSSGGFDDYELTHEFRFGKRTLLLNGRKLEGDHLILLAIEDITARQRTMEALYEREYQFAQLTSTLEEQVDQRTQELAATNLKLTDSSTMLASLFQANPIPTTITRASDGLLLDANDEFLAYFGLKREEVLFRPAVDLQKGWASEADLTRLHERLQKDGFVRGLEMAVRHPSGEARNLLASIQIASFQDQMLIITTFIDITERVRAEQQIRELASRLTMAEQDVRHNLSLILHDDLQQRLYAIELQMSFLRDAVEAVDQEKLAQEFAQIKQELEEAIRITRHLSVDLSPPILHDEGLREALGWLAAQMKEQYNLTIEIQATESFPIPDTDMRVLLFQSVREGLFNIVKHAGVLKAYVSLEQVNQTIRIQIRDGGKGFDTGILHSTSERARGLANMRHRLSLFGGDLTLESVPGAGTHVTIVAPLQRSEPNL